MVTDHLATGILQTWPLYSQHGGYQADFPENMNTGINLRLMTNIKAKSVIQNNLYVNILIQFMA